MKTEFAKAIMPKHEIRSFRVHAELSDGSRGITAWYTDFDTILPDILSRIKQAGHIVLRIETQTSNQIQP